MGWGVRKSAPHALVRVLTHSPAAYVILIDTCCSAPVASAEPSTDIAPPEGIAVAASAPASSVLEVSPLAVGR